MPAALYKAMGGFATNGVNMTKLESYQQGASFAATTFYADIEDAHGKPALDIAGNGRYARQLVEAGEQSRDMRLVRSLDFDSLGVEQLSEINGEDMASAIAAVHSRLNISR